MFICICNAVTDKEIREAARDGITDLWALQEELGVATNCGSCSQDALAILNDVRQRKRVYPSPTLYHPSPSPV